jgi:molybdate transport system substrate-binding protein
MKIRSRVATVIVRNVLTLAVGASFAFGTMTLWAVQPGKPVLHVAAAADLEPVLPAVLEQFEKATGIHAEATYKSSAVLAQQIINGAPDDIFFAADTSFPQKVIDAGMATESSPVPYARGTLVLWARNGQSILKGNPVTLRVLRHPGLRSVAIANPQHAPYGRAAQAAIQNMHMEQALRPKLRIADNIAQAAQYAESGNAQVGFLSLTSARTPRLSADGTYITIPVDLYPPLLQAAVVMKRAPNPQGAEKLLDFMMTPRVRAVLAMKGLAAPE